MQIVGALWYLLAVERNDSCWQKYCIAPSCRKDFLYCGNQDMEGYATWNRTSVESSCKPADDNQLFDFGIFQQALSSGIAASKDFINKYCYCLWWGLQNLRCVLPIKEASGLCLPWILKGCCSHRNLSLENLYYICMYLLLHLHSLCIVSHVHVEKNCASFTNVDEKFRFQISLKC